MKFLLLLLFIGCAAANLNNGLESDVQDELKEYLRDAFEKVIRKISKAIEEGKDINQEAFDKLKDLKEQMHLLEIEDHQIDEFKAKLNDHLFQILDKMGLLDKRSVHDELQNVDGTEKRSISDFYEEMKKYFRDLDMNFKNDFHKFAEWVRTSIDKGVEKTKDKIAVIKKMAEEFLNKAKSSGKDVAVETFCMMKDHRTQLGGLYEEVRDKVMERLARPDKRSISDYFKEIADYFKGLDIDFKNNFHKFGDWVKTSIEKGLEKTKDKMEVMKKMAEELLNKAKGSGKDVAVDSFCMMKEHRAELSGLYEVVRDKVMAKLLRI